VPRQETGEALAAMQALSESRFASPEGREGITAFREQRPPSWVTRFSA
jgi:enoyl-CoA hydratase/carnithine racemase